jgi:uncharacterized membrane protein
MNDAVERPARDHAFIGVLTLVALALRLHGLERESLWFDELYTWTQIDWPTFGEALARGIATDVANPPLYPAILFLWAKLAGTSAWALRLPSVLAGTACVPATYALGRRVFARAEARIAAALMACLWTPVAYGQEARTYAMALLAVTATATLGLGALQRAQRGQPVGAARCVALVVAALSASYLHYFGLMIVAMLLGGGAVALVRRRCASRAVVAVVGAWLVGLAPLAAIMVATLRTTESFWVPRPTWGSLVGLGRFFFGGGSELGLAQPVTLAALAGAGAVGVWAFRGLRERSSTWRPSTATLGLLAWGLVPIAAVFAWSTSHLSLFLPRYFIVVTPAVYLLVARSLTYLAPRVATARGAVAGLAALLALQLWAAGYYDGPRKEQFREAASVVSRELPPEPTVVVSCSGVDPRFFDYYLRRAGRGAVDVNDCTGEELERVAALAQRRGATSIWLLSGHTAPARDAEGRLAAAFRLVERHAFKKAAATRVVRR